MHEGNLDAQEGHKYRDGEGEAEEMAGLNEPGITRVTHWMCICYPPPSFLGCLHHEMPSPQHLHAPLFATMLEAQEAIARKGAKALPEKLKDSMRYCDKGGNGAIEYCTWLHARQSNMKHTMVCEITQRSTCYHRHPLSHTSSRD